MELKYSEQAQAMINNLSNFRKNDFEKWFIDNLSVGSNNVMMWIMAEHNKAKKTEAENGK